MFGETYMFIIAMRTLAIMILRISRRYVLRAMESGIGRTVRLIQDQDKNAWLMDVQKHAEDTDFVPCMIREIENTATLC